MEPQIRYTRTGDGVSIAYWTLGSGPPVLYCDFGMRFETVLAANFLLNDVLSSSARVTYLDQGGCGASDRDVTDMSAEAMVRAIEAVVFEDRGEHALKGIAELQRVYAVRKDGG